MRQITVDIEIYKNYSLFQFKDHNTGKVISIESFKGVEIDREKLNRIMKNNLTIGFNSINYDMPLICAAIQGAKRSQLKAMSDRIINGGLAWWQTYREFDIRERDFNHIDVMGPSPAGKTSLKMYGGRLLANKLQDLPVDPSADIQESQLELMSKYCENDLDLTWLLYTRQPQEFELREKLGAQYSLNLMSKSQAQIAELIMRAELTKGGVDVKKIKVPLDYSFKYKPVEWLKFETEELTRIYEAATTVDFTLHQKYKLNKKGEKKPNDKEGKVKMPEVLDKGVKIAGNTYKFGIGGIHSQEKKMDITLGDDDFLLDIDVASYYPNIILGQNLYPKHLTSKFVGVYRDIVGRRLEAKRTGDKFVADCLKIVINSGYGKFGSPYSFLFSPNLLVQTTITGQLAVLMLIERLTNIGIAVMSANTDGIVVTGKKSQLESVRDCYYGWEVDTGYELEETEYKAIYSRDVNNYLAVKLDGSLKGKGIFAETGLTKNPQTSICYTAVKEYLINETPVEDTISNCEDVTQFLSVRTVRGGAVWRDEYLGKAVRWYYSTDGESIHYKTGGGKVAKTDGAKPMMDLAGELPQDLDLSWYYNEANTILETIFK